MSDAAPMTDFEKRMVEKYGRGDPTQSAKVLESVRQKAQQSAPPERGFVDKAKDFLVEAGKSELSRGAATALLGPMAILGGPMIAAPAARVLRDSVVGDEPVAESIKKGAGEGALETGVGALTAAIPLARRPVGALVSRMSENKLVGGLSNYLKQLVERGGSAEAQKLTAGKLMNEAIETAGTTPIKANNYMTAGSELSRSASAKGAGGLTPDEKFIVDAADEVRRGGGTMTLDEMDRAVKRLGKMAAGAERSDPNRARILGEARQALIRDIEDAGGEGLSQALQRQEGSRNYAKALRKEDQQDLLLRAEDPLSLEKHIDPKKLAELGSGPRRAETEAMFKGDEAALGAFRQAVDAAKVLGKNSNTPVSVRGALTNLLSSHRMLKAFKDPKARSQIKQLIGPDWSAKPEGAAIVLGNLSKRLAELESEAVPSMADAEEPPKYYAGGKQ
jgi:hypothetical protein